MNTANNSFDTLLAEMSLALDLAAELESELKSAALTVPVPRAAKKSNRPSQAAPAGLGFGQAQPAF
jgi:hypothetical protein